MKRLLLSVVVCLLCVIPLTLFSQIITGPSTLFIGERNAYYASFYNMYGSIAWSVKGKGASLVSSIENSAMVEGVSPGGLVFIFADRYVDGIFKERATLEIYVPEDLQAPEIKGATDLTRNTIYIFNFSLAEGTTFHRYIIPEEYFEFISISDNQLKVKTKNKLGSTGIAIISKDADNNFHSNSISVYIGEKNPYSISSNRTSVCDTDQDITYIINETLPAECEINWTSEDLTLISGQGQNSATFRLKSNNLSGKVSVSASIKDLKEKTWCEIQNSEVWVGAPPKPQLMEHPWYENLLKPNGTYNLLARGDYATNLIWDIEGGTIKDIKNSQYSGYTTGSATVLTDNVPYAMFNISVKAENECGCSQAVTGATAVVEDIIPPGGGGLKPKPPGDGILLSAPLLPGLQPMSTATPVTVRVYNFNTGSLVHQQKNAVDFNLQGTNLKPGIYVVEKTDSGGNKTTEKVKKNQ